MYQNGTKSRHQLISSLNWGTTGGRTLGWAKSGGEQRAGRRGRARGGFGHHARRGGGRGSGEREVPDEGPGHGGGAAVAERHGQRLGVAVEDGAQDLWHPGRQVRRLLRLPPCRRRVRFHLGRRRRVPASLLVLGPGFE